MNTLIQLASEGLNATDIGLFGMRAAVGSFFAISGYHKLFNIERKAAITQTMVADNVPFPNFMKYWVPFWELTGGAMVIAGTLTAFACGVLAIICLVACCCEAKARVASYKPLDKADMIDDYLYLPEVLYLLMLVTLILVGPGNLRLL